MRLHRPLSHRSSRRDNLKRLSMIAALPALGALTAGQACAQGAYPDRPVRIVVNFPAGGPLDILARVMAEKMQRTLKQTVIVENQTGAAGNIGARTVANAAPDGYTLLFSIDTPFTLSPSVYKKMPFSITDLEPVTLLGSSTLTVATNPNVGVDSLKALILKSSSQPISFSSAGQGSPGHIAALMLSETTGMRINHIPYRGNAPAVVALLSGEVQAGILSTSGLIPQIQAKSLIPLAVAGSTRSTLLPDLPTVTELGYPGLELEFLFLALLPRGTPEPVRQALRQAMEQALAQQDIRDRLTQLDILASDLELDALNAKLKRMRTGYAKIIEANHLQMD